MHPLLETSREGIADLCRRYGVSRLEVFGSAAREDFDPSRSDVDFLVEYAPDADKTFDTFLSFKEALEGLLGRQVDLVELRLVRNPYVKASIERDRKLIYAA